MFWNSSESHQDSLSFYAYVQKMIAQIFVECIQLRNIFFDKAFISSSFTGTWEVVDIRNRNYFFDIHLLGWKNAKCGHLLTIISSVRLYKTDYAILFCWSLDHVQPRIVFRRKTLFALGKPKILLIICFLRIVICTVLKWNQRSQSSYCF